MGFSEGAKKLWDQVLWYKKRVIVVLKLYQLLSEEKNWRNEKE